MIKEYVRFFSNIFYLSVLLIILGLLVKSELGNAATGWQKYLFVTSDLINSIGIALLVANVFSFIIGTDQFIEFIKKILREIVVSNDFVKELDDIGKYKLAKLIIGPKSEISKIYSGIDKYFDEYIYNSLKIFNNIFRGKVAIHIKARIGSDSIVYFDEKIEYRSFRVDQKMAKMRYGFEDDRSKHIKTRITTPEGNSYELCIDDEKDNTSLKDNSLIVKKIQSIPDEFVKFEYLDIERNFIEFGKDHWGIFSYKASMPSDGLKLHLECYDGMTIRYVNTYGSGVNYEIDPINPEGQTEVSITFNNWLSQGFGIAILVSKQRDIIIQSTGPE